MKRIDGFQSGLVLHFRSSGQLEGGKDWEDEKLGLVHEDDPEMQSRGLQFL